MKAAIQGKHSGLQLEFHEAKIIQWYVNSNFFFVIKVFLGFFSFLIIVWVFESFETKEFLFVARLQSGKWIHLNFALNRP